MSYFRLCLLLLFASGIWWTGGPVYCFSPGKEVKVENHFTGCECPSTCKQTKEDTIFNKPGERFSPPLLLVITRAPWPVGEPFAKLTLLVRAAFWAPPRNNPLLYVKLLF